MSDDDDSNDDAFNDQLGSALSGRVGKRPDESEDPSNTERTDDTGDTDSVRGTSDTGYTGSTSPTGSSGDSESTGSSDDAGNSGNTGTTSEGSRPGPDPDPTSTRSTRTKYPIYLTETFQEELNQRYKRMNAQRIMDDEPEIEKHKHFLEAVLRAGLDRDDLDDYVEAMAGRY